MALGGLKRCQRCGAIVKGNPEVTFNLGLAGTGYHVPKPEPDPEVEPHIDVISPSIFIFIDFRDLVIVKKQRLMSGEDAAHRVRALLVLAEGVQVSNHVGSCEPCALEECIGLHSVVVDAELLVGVAGREVEHHVVAEGVVVVVVVELGYFGFGHVELEHAGLNHEPEYDACDDAEDDECNEELPEDAEEAVKAASAAVVAVGAGWLRRWNGGSVVGTVQVWLLIGHA